MTEETKDSLHKIAETVREVYKELADYDVGKNQDRAFFHNQTIIGALLLVEQLKEVREELEGIGDTLDLINAKLTQS